MIPSPLYKNNAQLHKVSNSCSRSNNSEGAVTVGGEDPTQSCTTDDEEGDQDDPVKIKEIGRFLAEHTTSEGTIGVDDGAIVPGAVSTAATASTAIAAATKVENHKVNPELVFSTSKDASAHGTNRRTHTTNIPASSAVSVYSFEDDGAGTTSSMSSCVTREMPKTSLAVRQGQAAVPRCVCSWKNCRSYQKVFHEYKHPIYDGVIRMKLLHSLSRDMLYKQCLDATLGITPSITVTSVTCNPPIEEEELFATSKNNDNDNGSAHTSTTASVCNTTTAPTTSHTYCKYVIARHHFTEQHLKRYDNYKPSPKCYSFLKPLSLHGANKYLYRVDSDCIYTHTKDKHESNNNNNIRPSHHNNDYSNVPMYWQCPNVPSELVKSEYYRILNVHTRREHQHKNMMKQQSLDAASEFNGDRINSLTKPAPLVAVPLSNTTACHAHVCHAISSCYITMEQKYTPQIQKGHSCEDSGHHSRDKSPHQKQLDNVDEEQSVQPSVNEAENKLLRNQLNEMKSQLTFLHQMMEKLQAKHYETLSLSSHTSHSRRSNCAKSTRTKGIGTIGNSKVPDLKLARSKKTKKNKLTYIDGAISGDASQLDSGTQNSLDFAEEKHFRHHRPRHTSQKSDVVKSGEKGVERIHKSKTKPVCGVLSAPFVRSNSLPDEILFDEDDFDEDRTMISELYFGGVNESTCVYNSGGGIDGACGNSSSNDDGQRSVTALSTTGTFVSYGTKKKKSTKMSATTNTKTMKVDTNTVTNCGMLAPHSDHDEEDDDNDEEDDDDEDEYEYDEDAYCSELEPSSSSLASSSIITTSQSVKSLPRELELQNNDDGTHPSLEDEAFESRSAASSLQPSSAYSSHGSYSEQTFVVTRPNRNKKVKTKSPVSVIIDKIHDRKIVVSPENRNCYGIAHKPIPKQTTDKSESIHLQSEAVATLKNNTYEFREVHQSAQPTSAYVAKKEMDNSCGTGVNRTRTIPTGNYIGDSYVTTTSTYKVQSVNITDPNGENGRYSGYICHQTGMPHGYGRLEYDEGNRWYEGTWRHGRWTGYGRLSNGDGDMYEGGLANDTKHGHGFMKFADGRTFEGRYDNGQMVQGKMTYKDGSSYNGSWSNGMRQGYGRCVFADKSIYEGEFHDGEFNGIGKMCWNDGGWYEGEWKAGEMNGFGCEVRPDGTVRHNGEWIRGKPCRNPHHNLNIEATIML